MTKKTKSYYKELMEKLKIERYSEEPKFADLQNAKKLPHPKFTIKNIYGRK